MPTTVVEYGDSSLLVCAVDQLPGPENIYQEALAHCAWTLYSIHLASTKQTRSNVAPLSVGQQEAQGDNYLKTQEKFMSAFPGCGITHAVLYYPPHHPLSPVDCNHMCYPPHRRSWCRWFLLGGWGRPAGSRLGPSLIVNNTNLAIYSFCQLNGLSHSCADGQNWKSSELGSAPAVILSFKAKSSAYIKCSVADSDFTWNCFVQFGRFKIQCSRL